MKLTDVSIMLRPSFRAYAYLQRLIDRGVTPSYAFLQIENDDGLDAANENNDGRYFAPFKKFEEVLRSSDIAHEVINSTDCNDPQLIDAISNRPESYVIFSGGGILRKPILSLGKKFLHVHPGRIPDYRGSTCMYYSILNEDNASATAFFMAPGIDAGDECHRVTFMKPDHGNIDYEYDCHIRAEVLAQTLEQYAGRGFFASKPQDMSDGEMYYIIHPVLKHIAILSCTE